MDWATLVLAVHATKESVQEAPSQTKLAPQTTHAWLAPAPMADVLQLAPTNSASHHLNAQRTIATTLLVGTVVSMKLAAIHRIVDAPIPV